MPLTLTYRLAISIRRYLLEKGRGISLHRAPVIVVGNITVGGTGKTPLLMALITELRERGYKPGVVTRGYGGRGGIYPVLVTENTSAEISGDEPLMIVRSTGCPVVADPKRLNALRYLLENCDCDLVLSDDGLQHYAMPRDIEIAVVDGARGVGNKHCLPAGPLREPQGRLHEVDFVSINVTESDHFQPKLIQLDPFRIVPIKFVNLVTQETVFVEHWSRSKNVHAVAAIGAPSRFKIILRQLGFNVFFHIYDDHSVLEADDLCFDDDLDIIITAKDAVKVSARNNKKLWVLEVEAFIESDLIDRLQLRLNEIECH